MDGWTDGRSEGHVDAFYEVTWKKCHMMQKQSSRTLTDERTNEQSDGQTN